ncbi:MAG: type II secretion system major pseudopilin GspG [Pseudomonadota bacterium]
MRTRTRSRRNDAGFTLTEIMVGVFIVGLMSTIVIINLAPVFGQGRATKVKADIAAIRSALTQYNQTFGVYPSEDQGLSALVDAPSELSDDPRYPRNGFIESLPDDPWGNAYQYIFPGDRSRAAYDVFSLGADGQPGGEEEDADIGNWT